MFSLSYPPWPKNPVLVSHWQSKHSLLCVNLWIPHHHPCGSVHTVERFFWSPSQSALVFHHPEWCLLGGNWKPCLGFNREMSKRELPFQNHCPAEPFPFTPAFFVSGQKSEKRFSQRPDGQSHSNLGKHRYHSEIKPITNRANGCSLSSRQPSTKPATLPSLTFYTRLISLSYWSEFFLADMGTWVVGQWQTQCLTWHQMSV